MLYQTIFTVSQDYPQEREFATSLIVTNHFIFLPGFVGEQSLDPSLSLTQTHSTTPITKHNQKLQTSLYHDYELFIQNYFLLIKPAWVVGLHAYYCASSSTPRPLPDLAGQELGPGHLTL